MSLRLPTQYDPLTVEEQADLEHQCNKMLENNLPSHNWLRHELVNVARLHATLQLYRALMDAHELDYKIVSHPRIVVEGVSYIQEPVEEE